MQPDEPQGAASSKALIDEHRERYARAPMLPAKDDVELRSLVDAAGRHVEIEVGPGRGGFMLERLAARADVAMIGFEVKRKWVTLVNERLERQGVGARGKVFADDAGLALPRLVPNGSIGALYLHFPDPWWKKRHEKRLVMRAQFLDQVARLLRPGGEFFVQTDVEERAERYEMQIAAHPAFEPLGDGEAPRSPRLADNPYQARSHRERRAIADRIPVYRLRFSKKAR